MPVKQVTTSVSEEVFKQFEQMCQSRGVTTYQGMKELIEIAIGQDSTFLDGKPEEPKLGMTAEEVLKTMKRPDWMKQSTTERTLERWRLEGRFNNGVPPEI